MYDPNNIYEKFNFKILNGKKGDSRFCLSSEHYPRSRKSLRFLVTKIYVKIIRIKRIIVVTRLLVNLMAINLQYNFFVTIAVFFI